MTAEVRSTPSFTPVSVGRTRTIHRLISAPEQSRSSTPRIGVRRAGEWNRSRPSLWATVDRHSQPGSAIFLILLKKRPLLTAQILCEQRYVFARLVVSDD